MRALTPTVFAIAVAVLTSGPVQAQTAGRAATVTATFSPRTALRVSTQVLEFHVTHPTQPASATVEFVAAARTGAASEVRLVVEPAGGISGPGGAADVETSLTLEGGAPGIQGGLVSTAAPTTAARWTSSGQRTGRLAFTLRASAPGTYVVPVRFAINVP